MNDSIEQAIIEYEEQIGRDLTEAEVDAFIEARFPDNTPADEDTLVYLAPSLNEN